MNFFGMFSLLLASLNFSFFFYTLGCAPPFFPPRENIVPWQRTIGLLEFGPSAFSSSFPAASLWTLSLFYGVAAAALSLCSQIDWKAVLFSLSVFHFFFSSIGGMVLLFPPFFSPSAVGALFLTNSICGFFPL